MAEIAHPQTIMCVKALIIIGALCGASAERVLKQIHVVTRHGSRYPLTQDPQVIENGKFSTLTDKGFQQMKDLGLRLRDDYMASFDFLPDYYPRKVHFESSNKDRTIVSATALGEGLFQGGDQGERRPYVPVHTVKLENDIHIRAYDKCQALKDEHETLYRSERWLAIQSDHETLLRKLGTIDLFADLKDVTNRVPLTRLWDVYDTIYVAKSECESEDAESKDICKTLDDPFVKDAITDGEFEELELLISKVESFKYNSASAGRFAGNNLLMKIVDRMKKSHQHWHPESGGANIFVYSSHYSVLLALFAALGHEYSGAAIPGYASAIVIELFEIDGKKFVSMLFHEGEGLEVKADHNPVQFFGRYCENPCPLRTLESRVSFWSEEQWCKDCGGSFDADVCIALNGKKCERDIGPSVTGGAAIGFVTGMLIMTAFTCSLRSKRGTTSKDVEQAYAGETPTAAADIRTFEKRSERSPFDDSGSKPGVFM